MKPCPKCGEPEGMVNCPKCREEDVALEVNSLLDWRIYKLCGRIMVGSGPDTYDPICELPEGHTGACKSTSAIDQHKLIRE